jgi:hypothetical protein
MALSFDGASATTNRWAFVAMFPSLDAIQEFKVLSGSYTAEYGGNAGANVNVQLKSGTNNLHGSAYEFLRNNVLDARNYFRPGPLTKDVLHRNQFGAVVRGRIIKDKTFSWWMGKPANVADTAEHEYHADWRGDWVIFGGLPDIDPLTGVSFGNIPPASQSSFRRSCSTYRPCPISRERSITPFSANPTRSGTRG